jgi:NAD(P)-dependent dehydrogenase (short-subunit alcohol dehydrogenase family)
MIDLSGKVAIVTGGAASIGASISKALHSAGAKVVVAARDEFGDKFAALLGDGAIFHRADVTIDSDLDALVDRTVKTFGGIDIVVNNAAQVVDNGIQSSRDDWLATLNVNVVSSALLVQKALPHLQQSANPSVVNIGSCTADVGIAMLLTYPTSKSAVHGLTRCLAVQLANQGVRVNAVAPGATESEPILALAQGNRETADKAVGPLQPLGGGRLANADEIADSVLYLCSDLARFVTGTVLAVDGGYAAMGPEGSTSVPERIMNLMKDIS